MTARRLVAAAALAAAAFGAAGTAHADPTCYNAPPVKGTKISVCGAGFVCDDTLCTWFNPDVTCVSGGGVGVDQACAAIDKL
jgi:hypothetical protein